MSSSLRGAVPDARFSEHNPLPPSSELFQPVRRARPGSSGQQAKPRLAAQDTAALQVGWDQLARKVDELSRKLDALVQQKPGGEPTPAQAKAVRAAATAMAGHLGALKRTGL